MALKPSVHQPSSGLCPSPNTPVHPHTCVHSISITHYSATPSSHPWTALPLSLHSHNPIPTHHHHIAHGLLHPSNAMTKRRAIGIIEQDVEFFGVGRETDSVACFGVGELFI